MSKTTSSKMKLGQLINILREMYRAIETTTDSDTAEYMEIDGILGIMQRTRNSQLEIVTESNINDVGKSYLGGYHTVIRPKNGRE